MQEVKAIIRQERLDDVIRGLHEIADLPGVTVSVVQGVGRREPVHAGASPEYGETTMAKLEIVVPAAMTAVVTETIRRLAHTGRAGDGKIFVIAVQDAIRIHGGENGPPALS